MASSENENNIENKTKNIGEAQKQSDQQKQQINDFKESISDAKNKFNENISENQQRTKEFIEKNVDATNKYQQDTINTVQTITNNFVELQKNLLDTYQSLIFKFLGDTSKSFGQGGTSPKRYADIYNKTNQTITDTTIDTSNKINEVVLGSTETFNKSIEIAQKYYNDSIQNFFNFLKKIERTSNQ